METLRSRRILTEENTSISALPENRLRVFRNLSVDTHTTSVELWRRYNKKQREGFGDVYKERAVEVLTRFLQVSNLEISESPFEEAQWKASMTLNTPLLHPFFY